MSDDVSSEKMRVCPSCRMQISVLATKCRFCGEEVGKPKDETRTLSIHDLGGEHVYHKAPSGSVMEAIEAFRVDEALQQSSPLGALDSLDLGIDPNQKIPGSGNAPSAFDVEYRPTPSASSKAKKAVPKSKTGLIAGIALGAVVVIAAVTAGPLVLSRFNQPEVDPNAVVYVNRAPGILRDGGPAIDALTAAVDAIGQGDNPKNRRIAEEAVAALEKEVMEKLNAAPFDTANLNAASSLATRGADLYPSEVTRRLVSETKDDNRMYKMVLVNIDSETDTATFKLLEDGAPDVSVREKEYVSARFLVRSIVGRKSVTLVDTRRSNRAVMYEVGSPPLPAH